MVETVHDGVQIGWACEERDGERGENACIEGKEIEDEQEYKRRSA